MKSWQKCMLILSLLGVSCSDNTSNKVSIDEDPVGEIIQMMAADRVPLFPNCIDKEATEAYDCFQVELYAHIQRLYKYPTAAIAGRVEGKVYVRFVINKLGAVQDVSLAKGIDAHLDYEAKRIVKLFPKFKPAVIGGEPVSVELIVPIPFRLIDKELPS